MSRSFRLSMTFLALPMAMALSSCGDGLDAPTGSATPSPTPGASATPTATPTPAPTATPGVKSCTLAPQRNCTGDNGPFEFGCCSERSIGNPEPGFDDAIDEAQRFVLSTRPELFDNGRVKGGSERTYGAAVAKRVVEQSGICAAAPTYIPEDEISLKNRQDKAQIFDIIQGNGTPTNRYATVCSPAMF